jgi:hypothetical protein
MRDLSSLWSQNSWVICKPPAVTGLKVKKTQGGLGFVAQHEELEELEVLSPTGDDAKIKCRPGDVIFIDSSAVKDCCAHQFTLAGSKETFVRIPFDRILFRAQKE